MKQDLVVEEAVVEAVVEAESEAESEAEQAHSVLVHHHHYQVRDYEQQDHDYQEYPL
ncbi:hypothetical protein DXG01_008851, partial [Tephrocybe rancida]